MGLARNSNCRAWWAGLGFIVYSLTGAGMHAGIVRRNNLKVKNGKTFSWGLGLGPLIRPCPTSNRVFIFSSPAISENFVRINLLTFWVIVVTVRHSNLIRQVSLRSSEHWCSECNIDAVGKHTRTRLFGAIHSMTHRRRIWAPPAAHRL